MIPEMALTGEDVLGETKRKLKSHGCQSTTASMSVFAFHAGAHGRRVVRRRRECARDCASDASWRRCCRLVWKTTIATPARRTRAFVNLMKLRFFLPLLVCIPARAGDRPNVLFVVVDDLRSEIGAYGCESVQSPNLDRLAKSAVTFDRAFCQQAVCSPSRTSVMTGLRPDTSKVWDLQTHFRAALPDVVTLGQHFRNHGYFVQGMGKIYHSGELDDPPTWSVPWQVPASELYGSPESRAIHERRMSSQLGSPLPQHLVQPPILPSKPGSRGPAFEAADVPDDTFQDGKVAELAIATLHELRAKPEPFFLAVGFIRPHLPFVAPKKYWDLYDPEKIPLAPNKFRPHAAPAFAIQDGSEMRHYHGIPTGSVPDDLARKLKHGYYAAISYADAQIGKVLDELDRLGLRENTIVIFWGDHGWKLGEHDAWCKHSNCENDARAPLLLSVPGMKRAGAHSGALVELVDIYPTLCELAGLPLPAHLEGLSFKPLIEDPDRAWKQAAFSQYPRRGDGRDLMGYSMRTERYRFTAWADRLDHSKIEALELYDHETDPQENTNVANRPENAALVARLAAQLRAGWRAAGPR